MELVTKESFKRQKFKPVPIGEDVFYLRIMSGNERDDWTSYVRKLPTDAPDERVCNDIYAPLLVKCLADSAGNRIFADADAPQLATDLDAKSQHLLFTESQKYNRLTEEAIDESKNVSGGVGSGNSGSSSPDTSSTPQ